MTQAPAITSANLAIRTAGALPGFSRHRPPQGPLGGPPGGEWPQGPPGGPPGGGWPQGLPGGPPGGGWPQGLPGGPPGGQGPAAHGWITSSLAGRQPTTFKGNRDKSEAFMDE